MLTPFHVALPVRDIAEARRFYGGVLGFAEGRSSKTWVDYNVFGHQVVVHLCPSLDAGGRVAQYFNPVDGHDVPVPHFGVVLEMPQWQELSDRLQANGVTWVIKPYVRFQGQAGEQATMFVLDPSGNAFEFKSFRDIHGQLFAKQ